MNRLKLALDKVDNNWHPVIKAEMEKDYFTELGDFLEKQYTTFKDEKEMYPPPGLIFNTFTLTPPEEMKVVILGQDPYINPGEAMGLAFSVPEGTKRPPSLVNVFKAIQKDYPLKKVSGMSTDLTRWANQGVLLLNTALTVRQGKSNSHSKYWQSFTDHIIKWISDNKQGIVFLLWGNHAKSKKKFIDTTKHHILEWSHPSPLARRSFTDCGHFKKTNELISTEIDW